MTAPDHTPAASPAPGKKDAGGFKDTLNLPKTSFAMKADLVQNEPKSLKRWGAMKIYSKVRSERAGKERFVFHDGPPYANGSIHLGHLMNKCLKDFVVRAKTMAGFDVPYVPGWDCHGLPIEHKVMTDLIDGGKWNKLATLPDDKRRLIVRGECQKYAEKWVKAQGGQMQKLLTLADYEQPYLTMAPAYEAAVLDVLADLLEQGLVYRALKPVHWSIANETALAEAELEYYDRRDPSVYVDFEAADPAKVYDAFGLPPLGDDDDEDEDAPEGDEGARRTRPVAGVRPGVRPTFMIWTTTPWTLPANLAIAVNPKFTYALVFVDGNVTVMAEALVEKVTQLARSEEVSILARTTGDKLVGLKYRHPFVDLARGESVAAAATPAVFSVLPADYVTLEDGTGLVHTAPGHGQEDYQTGLKEKLPIYCPVRANGAYDDSVPEWLRGVDVWKANELVVHHLEDSGHLFHHFMFNHSYPHDWRSKTPTIFRCTEQWFVSVDRGTRRDGSSLRELGLKAVDERTAGTVAFVPEWGRNRMRGMLESRPDWCISRQRAWGLPIPAFVTPDGRTHMSAAVVRAVAALVREKGADAWFQSEPAELLKHYKADAEGAGAEADAVRAAMADPTQLKKGGDILDVWFESGTSWNAVLRQRNLGYPADLYLEGSDQHRGWFQTSLLPALGATGKPPFKTLLTHGFMVDKDGKKLSKSRADAKDYEVDNLLVNYGADVLRWWVASLPYENDVKVDKDFFASAGESYRKVRNTLRFMLSNLYDFTPSDHEGRGGMCVDLKLIPPTSLDAWVLAAFDRMSAAVRAAYSAYDFRGAHTAVYDFCNDTLSAVYLAAVKDRLYCDKADAARRRRTQTVLWDLTDGLCRLLAPILPHTADEAYRALHRAPDTDQATSVHMRTFIEAFGVQASPGWSSALASRDAAKVALEQAKAEMGVENPLDAGVILPDSDGALAGFDATELADLLGVSEVTISAGGGAPKVVDLRARPRCERSWRRDGTVRQRTAADGRTAMLSDRDAAAVGF